MTEPCPVCESKRELAAMEMTPELVEEMAAAETIADFCGQDELNRRLAICGACSRLINQMTCAECGCFVQFRARHATTHCANGLW